MRVPANVAFVGHRLGANDGISVASATWADAFRALGSRVETIAGEGDVDHRVGGLVVGSGSTLDGNDLASLLSPFDLVVVENCCSALLDPPASATLGRVLRDRPVILRHHDLSWQHPEAAVEAPPPLDRAWWQVTINERSRLELAARGIPAVALYHRFDTTVPPGDRERTRHALGLEGAERAVLQPTQGAPWKNIAGGMLLAASLGATYWLLGPVQPAYRPEFAAMSERLGIRVLEGRADGTTLADSYAACDVVTLPSSWEGFGNAAIEAAVHRRPLAIGDHPVATELRRYGFSWFQQANAGPIVRYLAAPDPFVMERNELVARVRFSADELPEILSGMLTSR